MAELSQTWTDKNKLMHSVSDNDIRKNFSKSHVLSWRWQVDSDWKDVTSSGREFQVFGPATGKARLPTVDGQKTTGAAASQCKGN